MLQRFFGSSCSTTKCTTTTPQSVLSNQVPLVRIQNRLRAYGAKNPNAKLLLAGLGITSLAIAVNHARLALKNADETRERKERLSKPVVNLVDTSANPPFTKHNLSEWLYKTVTVEGRPIHSRAMMIPAISYGLEGFEYLVPFVTKENEDGSVQEGLILNLGFIPREYAPIYRRARIENVEKQQFDCVVTDGDHLSKQGGLFACNNVEENKWEYANLAQLAKHTGFVNAEQTASCILEHVNPNTPNDERDCRHVDISADYKQDYPYRFTRGGVLQQPGQMYWDHNKASSIYGVSGLGFTIVSALLFLAK